MPPPRTIVAEGAHSCAGQATQARDTKSFILLPAGDCAKIQGGNTTSTWRRRMSHPAVKRANPIPAQAGIGLRFQHHQAVIEARPDIA
jgi:predicted integral membrane protein DUF2282